MIKISKDTKDTKLGSKQVLKVYRGVDIVWEKQKAVEILKYSGTGNSTYYISVYPWTKLNPNKNYRFTTNVDGKYSMIVDASFYTIKNNDVFRITKKSEISIKNINFNYYDIKIYEVKEEATIIIT